LCFLLRHDLNTNIKWVEKKKLSRREGGKEAVVRKEGEGKPVGHYVVIPERETRAAGVGPNGEQASQPTKKRRGGVEAKAPGNPYRAGGVGVSGPHPRQNPPRR